MENITKVYPNGFVANKNVNFSVEKGEIHALAGENGAGKSTLMKMLFGVEQPDSGKIILKGEPVTISSPAEAIALGIGMVHQHFMLAPSLTVAENIIMGVEPRKSGIFIDRAEMVRCTKEIAEKYRFDIDPEARVKDLPVGTKQKIEILKALLRGAEILILDEPTAVLTPQETQELFVQLKLLCEKGHTIIFISHKLREIKELCNRLTILRRGVTVGTSNVRDLMEKEISRLMVGRDVILEVSKKKAEPGETILRMEDVSVKDKLGKYCLNGCSFRVRRGEILGVAGIEGNGQREIAETITGMQEWESGDVRVKGASIRHCSIHKLRAQKISHVPEDRMTYGIMADGSIKENLIADCYDRPGYCHIGMLRKARIEKEVDEEIAEYQIKCDDREQPVRMLSGGNIQKVVVAREFSSHPDLIIINQPTRGIDVGATEFVRKQIVKLRDDGAAVLLISADLNEVLELSDSLIVMCEGKIGAYFPDTESVTEEELGEYMLGIKTMNPEEIGGVCRE